MPLKAQVPLDGERLPLGNRLYPVLKLKYHTEIIIRNCNFITRKRCKEWLVLRVLIYLEKSVLKSALLMYSVSDVLRQTRFYL